MNADGQWLWYAGVTAILLDTAGTIRPEVTPKWWFIFAGIGLVSTGLAIMAIQGAWVAWEEFEANAGGDSP